MPNPTAQAKLQSFERLDREGAYNQALRYLYEAATALDVALEWSDKRGSWRVCKGDDERFFTSTWAASQMLWDYSNR